MTLRIAKIIKNYETLILNINEHYHTAYFNNRASTYGLSLFRVILSVKFGFLLLFKLLISRISVKSFFNKLYMK